MIQHRETKSFTKIMKSIPIKFMQVQKSLSNYFKYLRHYYDRDSAKYLLEGRAGVANGWSSSIN